MDNTPTKRTSAYGHKEENLRGTLVAVFLIGGAILALWLIVFYMYLVRI